MKFSSFSILFVAVLIFTGCEPEADMFYEFVIRKGEHYASNRMVQSMQSATLSFDARFDASAIYSFQDAGFQDSKNKLLGFADCNSSHHQNSARFAWQWYDNKLEIYAYCYVNSTRVEKFIGVVELDEVNHYEIQLKDEYYAFRLNNDEPVKIERSNKCDKGVYYMLWPYFGGSLPAPHDVHIFVKTLY